MQRLESIWDGMIVGLGICTDVFFVNKSDGLVDLSLVWKRKKIKILMMMNRMKETNGLNNDVLFLLKDIDWFIRLIKNEIYCYWNLPFSLFLRLSNMRTEWEVSSTMFIEHDDIVNYIKLLSNIEQCNSQAM